MHVMSVALPARQLTRVLGTPVYPALHDMLQLAPCAKVPSEEQLPRLPLVGADSPVQLAGSHTTELDTVPALHDGC